MGKNRISVTVVVNGEGLNLEANNNEPLSVLANAAIRASQSTEKNLDKWELTTEEGQKLSLSDKVGEAGVLDQSTLLLNLKTGAAG